MNTNLGDTQIQSVDVLNMNLLVRNDDVCRDSVCNDCDVTVDSILVFSTKTPRPSVLSLSSTSSVMPVTICSLSAVLDVLFHKECGIVVSIDFSELEKLK